MLTMSHNDVLKGLITIACALVAVWVIKPFIKTIGFGTSRHPSSSSVLGTTANSSALSLQNAYNSFFAYPSHVTKELKSYQSRLGTLRGAHARLAREIGYGQKIASFEKAGESNALVTKAICDMALRDFPHLGTATWPIQLTPPASGGQSPDIARVKEALKHLVRDWSLEGEAERRAIYIPIITELEKVPVERRSQHKVLVPGSGLGRLGWEIAQMGFNVTTVELSYYMSLTLRFLLSGTSHVNQHTVHPYIHWWSHQRSNLNTFRGIQVPDVLPRRMDNWTINEGDFLTLCSDGSENRYDTIITLYFIDTASNLITYLQHIYHLLRPNGTWINLGPLLYSNATIELSLEDVIKLVESIGFEFEAMDQNKDDERRLHQIGYGAERIGVKTRTIPSEYTADRRAMMKWVYQAEFWVARKNACYGDIVTL